MKFRTFTNPSIDPIQSSIHLFRNKIKVTLFNHSFLTSILWIFIDISISCILVDGIPLFVLPYIAIRFMYHQDKLYYSFILLILSSFIQSFHSGMICFFYAMICFFAYKSSLFLPKFHYAFLTLLSVGSFLTVIHFLEGSLFSIIIQAMGHTFLTCTLILLSRTIFQSYFFPSMRTKKQLFRTTFLLTIVFYLLFSQVELVGINAGNIVVRYILMCCTFIYELNFFMIFCLIAGWIGMATSHVSSMVVHQLNFIGLTTYLFRKTKINIACIHLVIPVCINFYLGSFYPPLSSTLSPFIGISTIEIISAVILFLLTPSPWLRHLQETVSKSFHRPQRVNDANWEELLRDKQRSIANFCRYIAGEMKVESLEIQKQHAANQIMHSVHDEVCATCLRQVSCWERNATKTKELVHKTLYTLEGNQENLMDIYRDEWQRYCVHPLKIYRVLERNSKYMKKQLREFILLQDGKRILQKQWLYAAEFLTRGHNQSTRECDLEKIIDRIAHEMGVPIIYIHQSNDTLLCKTDMNFLRSTRWSNFLCKLQEATSLHWIVYGSESLQNSPFFVKVRLQKELSYRFHYGNTQVRKTGEYVSGDAFFATELSNGRFMIALSDGMGSGNRAIQQSQGVLTLFRRLFDIDVSPVESAKFVNLFHSYYQEHDAFATLDVMIFDQADGSLVGLKMCASPSIVFRQNQLIQLERNQLPIGIITDVRVNDYFFQLHVGDIVILSSDGWFDCFQDDLQMIQDALTFLHGEDPQVISDHLMELALYLSKGSLSDDVTVIVIEVNRDHLMYEKT